MGFVCRIHLVRGRIQLHGACRVAEFLRCPAVAVLQGRAVPFFPPTTFYPPFRPALRHYNIVSESSAGRTTLFGYNMRPVQVASGIQAAESLPIREASLPSPLPALALVGALFLATLASGRVFRPAGANLGRPVVRDTNTRMGIDPNTAHWFELAQLPGIGESLARKIVGYRESLRAAGPNSDRPIFESAEKLLPIAGIGPRMMARIRPFLRFPPPATRFDSVNPNR